MATKQPPAFTVRADEITAGHYIVIQSTTPTPRPLIVLVLETERHGDDVEIILRGGSFITSEGNLYTCLGDRLDIR